MILSATDSGDRQRRRSTHNFHFNMKLRDGSIRQSATKDAGFGRAGGRARIVTLSPCKSRGKSRAARD